MDDKELERLTKICSIHNYEKDACLFMKGDTSDHLLILIEGIVSVFKHDNKGNEIIIGLFRPYSMLAEPAILKGIPFPSTAVFKSKGAVVKVKLDIFKDEFLRDPHISYEVIQSLLGKIQLLQHNIHLNIASSAKEKILHFYQQNGSFSTELKNYEIASLLGMTAETFSRNLKQLHSEGKIKKTASGYQSL
jgi:CRP/FNR family transcriptional regulator